MTARRLPGAPPPPLAEPLEMSESDAIARMAAQKERESLAEVREWNKAHPPAKPKQKRLRVPEALRLEVLRLHDKGDGLTRISRATGLHRSTVQRIVEREREREREER